MKRDLSLLLASILLSSILLLQVVSAASAPAQTSSAGVSKVTVPDLTNADDAAKKKYYTTPDNFKGNAVAKKFSLQEYFNYNPNADVFKLGGPPPISLAKGAYEGTFEGSNFGLTISGKDKVSKIAAGTQELHSIPPGSRVVWDGKRLQLFLPGADGKTSQNGLMVSDEKGAGYRVSIKGDQKSGFMIETTKESKVVFHDTKVGDTTIKGKATVATQNGRITGEAGTQVAHPKFGTFEFQDAAGSLTISTDEARFNGHFLHETVKDQGGMSRHLDLTGNGAFNAGKATYRFEKGGSGVVKDLDLGVTAVQKDNSAPFSVGLNKGTVFSKENGMVIARVLVAGKTETPRLTKDQIKSLKLDLIDAAGSNVPRGVKQLVKGYIENNKQIGPSEISAISTKWGQETGEAPFMIVMKMTTLSAFKEVVTSTLASGDVSRINALLEDLKSGKVNPGGIVDRDSMKSIVDKWGPSLTPAQKKVREIVSLTTFGQVGGNYLSDNGVDVPFETSRDGGWKIKPKADFQRQNLPIELKSSEKPSEIFVVNGRGIVGKFDHQFIAPSSWTQRITQAPLASDQKVKDAQAYNQRNFNKYGEEARFIVQNSDRFKRFSGVFGENGESDISKIMELQRELGFTGEAVDGRLGPATLDRLRSATGGAPGYDNEAYQRQQNQDESAHQALKRTSRELVLEMRVRAAFNENEQGKMSDQEYEKVVNDLEARNPGLDIDIDSGKVNKFPQRLGGKPGEVVADVAGEDGKVRLADLYLSNPRLGERIDEISTTAQDALKNPKDTPLQDELVAAQELEKMMGGRKQDAAAAIIGPVGGKRITEEDSRALRGALESLSSSEFIEKINAAKKDPQKLSRLLMENGDGLQKLMGIQEKAKTLFARVEAGLPLSRAEIDVINLVKEKGTLDAINNVERLIPPNFKEVTSPILNKIRQVNSQLKFIDAEGFAKPNPFGFSQIADTFRRLGLDADSIPQGMSAQDGQYVGMLLNSKKESSSALGLIPLIHMGLDRGDTVVVASKDGLGRVAVTLNQDGKTVSFKDITDPNQFKGYDTITIDIPKMLPEGSARFIASLPSAEVRSALIRSALGVAGDNPFTAKEISGSFSGVQGSKLRNTPPTAPVQIDFARLYAQGDLDISGIKSQGMRRMFGGMNEIDATKALLPDSLMQLAEKHNFNADAVLEEIHRKYTKRTGADEAIRSFVTQYQNYRLKRK